MAISKSGHVRGIKTSPQQTAREGFLCLPRSAWSFRCRCRSCSDWIAFMCCSTFEVQENNLRSLQETGCTVSSEPNSRSAAEDSQLELTTNPDLPLQGQPCRELAPSRRNLCGLATDLSIKNQTGQTGAGRYRDHRTLLCMWAYSLPEALQRFLSSGL